MSTSTDDLSPPAEPDEQETIPALFHHCVNVYEAMFNKAKLVDVLIDGGSSVHDQYDSILVYEGHLTRLFQELHLSVPYYTTVTRDLKRMGCITQLRRGGGSAPSQWQLHHEPTEDLYRNSYQAKRPVKGKTAALEQRVSDLSTRVSVVEEVIQAMLANTDKETS